MFRFAIAVFIAALLTLAGGAVVMAQPATPTLQPTEPAPTPDTASYEEAAEEQMGSLFDMAISLYPISGVPTDTAKSAITTLNEDVLPFARDTIPPTEFAPFQARLFTAVLPCLYAAAIVQQGKSDLFSTNIASIYTQGCYDAVSDTYVEWVRATGKMRPD